MNSRFTIFIALCLFFISVTAVWAQNSQGDQQIPEEFLRLSGIVEGTGTHFEIADSEYLNLILDSSESVTVRIESIPEIITINIESDSPASAAEITISGFEPETTYHKYEDDFHNHEVFTTDSDGKYKYNQNLEQPHIVFIQPMLSTIFVDNDGWHPDSAGTFENGTATLMTDVSELIQIDADNIVLDGNGHKISNVNYGMYLKNRTGITIKNVIFINCTYGINLYQSDNNTIKNNTFSSDTDNNTFSGGIYCVQSNSNIVENNTFSFNNSGTCMGINVNDSADNIIKNNLFTNNNILTGRGVYLLQSSDTKVENNKIYDSSRYGSGIISKNSNGNTIVYNTITSEYGNSIMLEYSFNETVQENILTGNDYWFGIYVLYSHDNICKSNDITGFLLGIYSHISHSNTYTDNNIYSNYNGMQIYSSDKNTLYENTFLNNTNCGVILGGNKSTYIKYNTFYHNNFISNSIHVYAEDFCANNSFYQAFPAGGNYWDNWTSPDVDGDGFVDEPYDKFGVYDKYPLTRQDGWKISPVADAGSDQTVIATGELTDVTLDGSGSSDPKGNDLTYIWTYTVGSEKITVTAENPIITVSLPVGKNIITLIVNNGICDSGLDQVIITVEDNTPPEIHVTVSPEYLWPPNHKMVEINANIEVYDIADPAPTVVLELITAKDPEGANGSGNTEEDIHGAEFGTSDYTFSLRAERPGSVKNTIEDSITGKKLNLKKSGLILAEENGEKEGRTYEIVYSATDNAGNNAFFTVYVCVDKNQGNAGKIAVQPEPDSFRLFQNVPNPFNPTTAIHFEVSEPARLTIIVYNILGQEITTLVNNHHQAGRYTVIWNGTNDNGEKVSTGIYIYHLRSNNFSAQKKMLFIK